MSHMVRGAPCRGLRRVDVTAVLVIGAVITALLAAAVNGKPLVPQLFAGWPSCSPAPFWWHLPAVAQSRTALAGPSRVAGGCGQLAVRRR